MKTPTKQTRENRNAKERPPIPNLPELYHVIIQCADESQQRDLYERLKREGYCCRVVVL